MGKSNPKFGKPGNSMVEYVLPLSLTVGLVVICLTQGDFVDSLQGFLSDGVHGTVTANGKLQVEAFAAGTAPIGVSSEGTETLEGGDVVELGQPMGSTLNSPRVSFVTETAGGLGGANQVLSLSEKVKIIASQIRLDNVAPWVVDWVTSMANQGHTLGNNLYESWAHCPPDKGCDSWYGWGMADAIGPAYAQGMHPSGDPIYLIDEIKRFEQSGVLSDHPAEKQQIVQLITEL